MEFKPLKENIKPPLDVLRGKILRALALGSFALFLQACGMTREQIDALPTTTAEEINENGKALSERFEQPIIKTEGFVEDLGRKGETKEKSSFGTDITVTHKYIIRSSLDPKSSSVGMIATYTGEERVIDIINHSFDKIEFPSFDPKHKIEIRGPIVSVGGGKEIKYVVQISLYGGSTFDLTAATLEKKE